MHNDVFAYALNRSFSHFFYDANQFARIKRAAIKTDKSTKARLRAAKPTRVRKADYEISTDSSNFGLWGGYVEYVRDSEGTLLPDSAAYELQNTIRWTLEGKSIPVTITIKYGGKFVATIIAMPGELRLRVKLHEDKPQVYTFRMHEYENDAEFVLTRVRDVLTRYRNLV